MTNSDFNFRTPKTKTKVSLTAELARIDRIARSSFSPIPMTLGQAIPLDVATPELTEKSNPTNLTEEEIKEFLDAAIKVKRMFDAAVVNGFYGAIVGLVGGAYYGYYFEPYDSWCIFNFSFGVDTLKQLTNAALDATAGMVGFGAGGALLGATYELPDKYKKYQAAFNALKQISIELDKLGKYTSQPVISNLPAAGHVAGKSCGTVIQKMKDTISRLKATTNKKS